MVGGPSEPRRAESDCRSGRPGQPRASSCRGGGDLPRNAGYCSGFSLCCDSRSRNCASGVVAEATEGEDRLIRPVPQVATGNRVDCETDPFPSVFQGGVAAPLIKRPRSLAAQTKWLVISNKIWSATLIS